MPACDPFLINVLKPARGRFLPDTGAVMAGTGGEVDFFLILFGCFVQINSDNKVLHRTTATPGRQTSGERPVGW